MSSYEHRSIDALSDSDLNQRVMQVDALAFSARERMTKARAERDPIRYVSARNIYTQRVAELTELHAEQDRRVLAVEIAAGEHPPLLFELEES